MVVVVQSAMFRFTQSSFANESHADKGIAHLVFIIAGLVTAFPLEVDEPGSSLLFRF